MTMTEAPAIVVRSLTELEAVVDSGLHKFIEVGEALAEIRERRLYRETHESFETYCSDRYNLKRQRAYEMMAAANVVARMSEISDIVPERESHAAALAPLRDDPPAMVEALAEAALETGGKPTAAIIERVVERRTKREPAPVAVQAEEIIELEPDPPSDVAGAWFLIGNLAAFIRDEYLTKIVMVSGLPTRHDRHCDYGKDEKATCARRCSAATALLLRAELGG